MADFSILGIVVEITKAALGIEGLKNPRDIGIARGLRTVYRQYAQFPSQRALGTALRQAGIQISNTRLRQVWHEVRDVEILRARAISLPETQRPRLADIPVMPHSPDYDRFMYKFEINYVDDFGNAMPPRHITLFSDVNVSRRTAEQGAVEFSNDIAQGVNYPHTAVSAQLTQLSRNR